MGTGDMVERGGSWPKGNIDDLSIEGARRESTRGEAQGEANGKSGEQGSCG